MTVHVFARLRGLGRRLFVGFTRGTHVFLRRSPRAARKAACVGVAAFVMALTIGAPAAQANGASVAVLPHDSDLSDYGHSIGRVNLVLNKSQFIRVDEPYSSVMVGSDKIADVIPITDQTLYILGKALGSTRLIILNGDKHVLKVIEIEVNADMEGLRDRLAENLPAEDIRVSAINDGILLSGIVRDATELDKAVAIAERFAPDRVTNALKVAASQQVILEVRFVEATRTAARELGIGSRGRGEDINFDIGGQAFVSRAAGPLLTSALTSGAEPFGTLIATLLSNGTDVDLLIRALEEKSLVRRLAEPNLTALSGDTANFLAGGEFPFPVGADEGRISIEFKQFGVSLAFTPTVLGNGLINLRIVPEVSEIDQSNTVQVADIRIPGLIVRRANTTVELNDGQSFAIAGLLQHTHMKGREQLPWLGSVPVLGALFRSAAYQKRETDLVIIITPRLVRPKAPGERLATPHDNVKPGNDKDFFLFGRDEIKAKKVAAHGGVPSEQKPFGHIIYLKGDASYAESK